MIGQNKLVAEIEELIDNDKFPRFSILVGEIGSGKRTLAKHIPSVMDVMLVELPDVKVDTIREMIQDAYKIPYTCVFLIADADNMSVAAKNALLKVTEEPPNNAYFIMTVQDENNLLATIKSRGTIFRMQTYTPEEIGKFVALNSVDYSQDLEIMVDVCEVPGDVNLMMKYKPLEFYSFVESVVDNIAEVSGANAFKIGNRVAFKDEQDKYDLRLFWRVFTKICLDRMKSEPLRYANAIRITSKYLQELKITGISKIAAFDAWILDIREAWLK